MTRGAVLAMLAALAAGCRATLPGPAADGTIESAAAPITAEAIRPLEPGETLFDVVEGRRQAETVTLALERGERFGGTWVLREGDRRTEHYAVEADGTVVMPAAIDHEQRAVSLFRPPLVVAPAELAPGAAVEQTVELRVVAEGDLARRRESGTATQTIRFAGDQRIDGPRGPVTAHRVEIDFHADLSLADARTRTILYVADDGIVAIERGETVEVLGMPGRSWTQRLERRLTSP